MFGDNYTPTYSRIEIAATIGLVFVPLIAHFFLTLLRSGTRVVVVAPVLLLVAVQLFVGFQAFGGFVLREAGAGGGTPIDFIAAQIGHDPQHGCLILATSMYFYIEPIEPNKPCATLVRMAFTSSKEPARQVSILAHDQVSFPLARLIQK